MVNQIEFNEIRIRVYNAIEIFLLNHKELLVMNISEDTINHKLAEAIKFFFPDYNVDTEYNRSDFNQKILRLDNEKFYFKDWKEKNKQLFDKLYFKYDKLSKTTLENLENDLNKQKNGKFCKHIKPDIIVHIRSSRKSDIKPRNLLIIEIKTKFYSRDYLFDLIKLYYYRIGQLDYENCLFIDFSKLVKAKTNLNKERKTNEVYNLIWCFGDRSKPSWFVEKNLKTNPTSVEKYNSAIKGAYLEAFKKLKL